MHLTGTLSRHTFGYKIKSEFFLAVINNLLLEFFFDLVGEYFSVLEASTVDCNREK